jgi:hypothetical protein
VGIILVIAAYVIGHIVANLAGDLIERRLVADRLGRPTELLLVEVKLPAWATTIFPGYGAALPQGTRERVLARSGGLTGSALFYRVFGAMKHDEIVQERLSTFLNLYGFCRNMALALVAVVLFLVAGLINQSADTGPVLGPGWWLVAVIVGAVGMLYRYLKFYRQYALELLTGYAETELAP